MRGRAIPDPEKPSIFANSRLPAAVREFLFCNDFVTVLFLCCKDLFLIKHSPES